MGTSGIEPSRFGRFPTQRGDGLGNVMPKAKHRITANGRCQRQRNTDEAPAADVVQSWRCQKCSFVNDEDLPFCEICQEPKEEPSRDDEEGSDDEPQDWFCSKCSFKNSGLLPCCELCENARSSSSSAQEEVRPCPLCSFENSSSRTACAMCSSPLPAEEAASSASKPAVASADMPEAPAEGQCTEEERRLLQSMGWNPDEHDDDEGGLEDWEIDAAEQSLIAQLQAEGDRETLRDRARREFDAWSSRPKGST